MNKKPLIQLKDIVKVYDNKVVIDHFNLSIDEGAFITILGPSGCGKSTLLKMIAGFEYPTSGQILLNDLDIKDLPIYNRPTATVFQDYALFPTMNVFQNIAYGLKKIRIALTEFPAGVDEKISSAVAAAAIKAQKQLQKLASQKKLLVEKIQAFENKHANKKNERAYKLYQWMHQALINQLNDLDYHVSYWQTYPSSVEKKLHDKWKTRKITKEEIAQKVLKVINLVGLNGHEFKMPKQLSGGMQQRVALARAIVTLPKVLLLDEPLSALDAKVRKQMQDELKRLHKLLGITFILVTHDQEEALVLSDQVVVMSNGLIEQVGTSNEVYDSPQNTWVANFIGKANLFDGVYLAPGQVQVYDKVFETDVVTGFKSQEKVKVMMRPEDFDVLPAGQGIIDVFVESAIYMGKLWELKCLYQDNIIYVENIDEVLPNEKVSLLWDKIDVHVMHVGG